VIRLLSVLLGALPATWLGLSAVLLVFAALDGIDSIQGMLGVLWGLGGILGVVGAWLIIFDVGTRTKGKRRLVILLVSAGIAAASVLLILEFASLPWLSILSIASAIGVGVFQIRRVIRA
jgi:hypothetical protein